ncbi:MAG: DNA methyltransferase [Bacteroidota bacterium]|nr:DNA methyltransferase [Bacteroidota bacterium]
MSETLEYQFVKEIIPLDIERNSILNIVTRDVNTHTHGFHKYPAKFIPHIPKWAIEKYLNGYKGRTILDPFCGSGTTLVEGILAGHNVIGVDIDPLSAMISKVKTTRVDKVELKKISNWLIKEIKTKKKGTFKPDCETIEHWFTKGAIKKLSTIRTLINQIPKKFGENKKTKNIQDLLLICFSSIIRRISNADNESQKTYVSHTKVKKPQEVNTLFFSQLNLFIDRAIKFSTITNPKLKNKIICSSSSQPLNKKLNGQEIDLAITSPPYIKAIDYIYNQMVELFWIGDLFQMQTQEKQNKKKIEYIGNKQLSIVEFKHYTPYNTILDIDKLDEKLQRVFDTDKKNGHKHSYVTFKYFVEMDKHFAEMSKCLSGNTHYIMIVGDSSVSGIYFDTADFLIDIATRNGFRITNKWGYKIKNRFMRFDRKGRGGIIEIDWVLDFVKE